jgi:hypothetical protein
MSPAELDEYDAQSWTRRPAVTATAGCSVPDHPHRPGTTLFVPGLEPHRG